MTAEPAIAVPDAEGAAKTYSPKVQGIVNDISQLTLLEVADLNELLKKTLNISDAPVMMAGAAAPVKAAAEVRNTVHCFNMGHYNITNLCSRTGSMLDEIICHIFKLHCTYTFRAHMNHCPQT